MILQALAGGRQVSPGKWRKIEGFSCRRPLYLVDQSARERHAGWMVQPASDELNEEGPCCSTGPGRRFVLSLRPPSYPTPAWIANTFLGIFLGFGGNNEPVTQAKLVGAYPPPAGS